MHNSTVSPTRVSRNKPTVSCNDICVISIELTLSKRSPRCKRPSSIAAPLGNIVLTYIGLATPVGLSRDANLKPRPSFPRNNSHLNGFYYTY